MHGITGRSPFVLVLVLLVAATACNRAPPAIPKFTGNVDFTIIHSEHDLGNIEPCTCSNRTTGGFPRRMTALEDERKKTKHVLSLDAGNALFSEDRKFSDPLFMAQAKVKAKAIAQAFVKTGLDAMVFGEIDLAAGGDYFLEVAKETNLPIVVANVFDRESGKPLFQRYKIFDFDGLKVAVFGLVAQELHPTVSEANEQGSVLVNTNNKVTVILEDRFDRKTVKIEDPIKTAQELVPELLGQAHLIVALTHLPTKMTQDLPAQVPGINFIVGRHAATSHATFTIDSATGTMALGSTMNGTSVGIAEFAIRNGSLSFSDYSGLDNVDDVIVELKSRIDSIVKEYGTDDAESIAASSPDDARKLVTMRANLKYNEERKAQTSPQTESHFTHTPKLLDSKIKDDPTLADLVKQYREELKKLYDPNDTTHPKSIDVIDGKPHFVGVQACAKCHRAQTEFWRNTKHGHAWQTMLDAKVEYDLECITCHTVAFNLPGGFARPDRVAGFEDVQCENCHGPGSNHVQNILSETTMVDQPSAMQCERCHTREHSPAFKRTTYVPRASCPPIDPRDPLIRGVYGKMREDFEETLAKKGGSTPPAIFSSLLDVDLRLEQWEKAIDVAELGIKSHARIEKGMTIGLARALDGLGRTNEGLERLLALHEKYKDEPRFTATICDLLIGGKDPSARNPTAAREYVEWAIEHYEQDDGAFRLMRARLEHMGGNVENAIEQLRALIKNSPAKNSELTALLNEWLAELDAIHENEAPPPLAQPPAMK